MNDDNHTIESGHLDVGDGHEIYYQRWGSPSLPPIFFLHGGPGSGTKDKYRTNFDPTKHQIIFHDQRGSGKSTPYLSIENNTTQDLIEDIEKLRKHFEFEKIQLTGGSWGSFLVLAYAVTYPEHVTKILIDGIFTGTQTELDYIQQGGLKTHYPEAWEQYIEVVPESFRHDTTSYYFDKMTNGTEAEKLDHVKRWVLLESSAMSIDSDFTSEKQSTDEFDETSVALAILEAHYFVNSCFVENDFLYDNVAKLKNCEIVMVHGRYDHVVPPYSAYELAKLIGENCHIQIVPASHGNENALREVKRAYAWSFLG